MSALMICAAWYSVRVFSKSRSVVDGIAEADNKVLNYLEEALITSFKEMWLEYINLVFDGSFCL